MYVLDEPSIGLHQRDNDKLIKALRNLTDIGNTLVVVEHDEDTMKECDYLVDIGPGAGVHGGEIVACGTIDDIIKEKRSITGKNLHFHASTVLQVFQDLANLHWSTKLSTRN